MKLIKFLLLIIIFAGGVFVGHKYLPEQHASNATAVSLPPLETHGFDTTPYTTANINKTIVDFKAALSSGAATAQQQEQWLAFLENAVKIQDYRETRLRYIAEIAKNNEATPVSSEYMQAFNNFYSAKRSLEAHLAVLKAAPAVKEDAAVKEDPAPQPQEEPSPQ